MKNNMKISYAEGTIVFRGVKHSMEDIRKQYIKSFPAVVAAALIKGGNRPTVDWREVFHNPNTYIILCLLTNPLRWKKGQRQSPQSSAK